ncbi:MAG TPA: PHP domain-containing protein [Acidimicrobiia bacterium]|jgi:histidinol-phosphatase (PHP family)|nr:PHP domain-containing protein [Acidimicrobiia bacterium]
MGDYHVHLHPHGPYDGTGPPPGEYPVGHIEAYLEAALGRGADEIAFTEHLYRCVEAGPVLGRFWEREPDRELAAATAEFVVSDMTLSLEAYVDAVLDARDAGFPVLLGMEVDFFPDTIGAVLEFLEPYPWDILIGSVHWVGGWSIDHTNSIFEFDRRGIEQSYLDYFALETQLAASGAVDVLAHVDVVKKMGHRLPAPPIAMYGEVVAAAATSGVAVEVSSAGLHQKIGEIYPAPEFLEMFAASGVPITLASDAHYPADAARDRDVVIAAARRAGYSERLRFRRRDGQPVPLEEG